MALAAAKGQQRSQRLFTELLDTVERERRAAADAWIETAIEYKASWEHELERRASLGVSGPEPVPHPDQIIIDFVNNSVSIRGPLTKEQKVHWDRLHQELEKSIRFITELTAKLGDPEHEPEFPILRRLLNGEKIIRAKIETMLGLSDTPSRSPK